MKRIISAALLFALLLISASQASAARPRIAIRGFENKTDEPSVPSKAITDMMTTELGKARIFSIFERENLDYVTDEIRLGQSGLMEESTAPQVGKLKGAQYTMTGAVTLYHYNVKAGGAFLKLVGIAGAAKTGYVTLDIRIIDNTTGEIVYVNSETGSAKRSGGGAAAYYSGFGIGAVGASYGGILAEATRDAVIKHINTMKEYEWD
ncbi:MAG: hypothetical protein IJR63_02530 [Synergistaceae bacterium]|nr:hypothetical protein [Synergistaceae bacterium]